MAPYQTPTKSGYLEGPLYIARAKLVGPAELSQKLQDALNASEAWMRQGALTELEALVEAEHGGLVVAAELRLVYIGDDDYSFKVRAAAARCLADLAEQDRIARDEADAEPQRQEKAAEEEKAKAEARRRAEAAKRKAKAEYEAKVDADVREANEAMAKAAAEQKAKAEAARKRKDVRDWIILATLFIIGNVLAGLVGRWHEAAVKKYFTIDWPLTMAITFAVIGVFLGTFSDDDGSLWLTTGLTTWPGYLIGFWFFPSDPAQGAALNLARHRLCD